MHPTDEPALTADEDPTPAEPTEKQWRVYEQEVIATISKLDPEATVEWNVALAGEQSGRSRQLDGLVTGERGGAPVRIADEAKRYKRKIGIGTVDAFVGKLHDVDVDFGILYSFNGADAGAVARAAGARHPKILLHQIPVVEPAPHEWSDNLEELFDDCPACRFGGVTYTTWRAEDGDGERGVDIGKCGYCGAWSVYCRACGERTEFYSNQITCGACGAGYALVIVPGDADPSCVEVTGPPVDGWPSSTALISGGRREPS